MTAIRRLILIILCSAVAVVTASCSDDSATQLAVRPTLAASATPQVILVVGDSLVAQATADLRAASTSAVEIRVAAQLGSAPCDWTGGAFAADLAEYQPTIVVFAFTGNAGFTRGCVDSRLAYPLTELLANYQANLASMADQASATGATVVFSTPPARNPAVAAPPPTPTASALRNGPQPFYGFQGVAQMRSFYVELAQTPGKSWKLSNDAALAVSPDFVYSRTLPCTTSDGTCPSGFVDVRDVPTDAIHLDRGGHGAARFAAALVSGALRAAGH